MRITKENLTRYDQHFKSWHRRRLGYGKALENWRQTEEAGVVQFYPVGGSALEGKVKFSFKETPPASGDKSPSNPSTISGVPNIHITRCGKNLLQLKTNYSFPYFDHGITYTDGGDGIYTANGTCPSDGTNDSWLYFSFSGASSTWLYSIPVYASVGKYVISGCPSGGSSSTYMIGTQTHSAARANDFGSGGVLTVSRDEWTNFFIKIMKGQTVSNMKFAPQIEAGEAPTAFEKPEYNNYTIDLGNTYYGGEIDLATGLMTVTHSSVNNIYFSGADKIGSSGYTQVRAWSGAYVDELGNSFKVGANTRLTACCSIAPWPEVVTNELVRWYVGSKNAGKGDRPICFVIHKSLLDFSAFPNREPEDLSIYEVRDVVNAYLGNHPFTMIVERDTPYTVQLSPLALAALAQTSRHEPRLNTVYTDADSIQITYQKSPIRAATEQEMAILGLGGNV